MSQRFKATQQNIFLNKNIINYIYYINNLINYIIIFIFSASEA